VRIVFLAAEDAFDVAPLAEAGSLAFNSVADPIALRTFRGPWQGRSFASGAARCLSSSCIARPTFIAIYPDAAPPGWVRPRPRWFAHRKVKWS